MKKKTWLYYLIAGVILSGGTYMGLSPTITGPLADNAATAVSESTSIDD